MRKFRNRLKEDMKDKVFLEAFEAEGKKMLRDREKTGYEKFKEEKLKDPEIRQDYEEEKVRAEKVKNI